MAAYTTYEEDDGGVECERLKIFGTEGLAGHLVAAHEKVTATLEYDVPRRITSRLAQVRLGGRGHANKVSSGEDYDALLRQGHYSDTSMNRN